MLPFIDFPEWILNAIVVGKNDEGEQVAIGLNKGAYITAPYVWKLSKLNNCWVTIRPATEADLNLYDQIFCKQHCGIKW